MDQHNGLDANEQPETLDQSNAMILEGTVFDNDWVIGKQTGSTEHANIYSVTHKGHDADSDITYEARSYNFDNLSPQVKSNRARAIRRLSGRTVLSTTWNDLRVVIYRTGAIVQEKKDKMENSQGDIVVAGSACKKPRQKTTRQQESDRLRQRSRRRRVRQERAYAMSQDEDQEVDDDRCLEGIHDINVLLSSGPPIAGFGVSIQPVEVDANEFCFFELLHLINGDETIRQKVAPVTRSKVEDYLAAKEQEVEVDGEDALLEFIAIKEREIVFLQRTNNKFKPVLKNWSGYSLYAAYHLSPRPGPFNYYDNDLRIFDKRYKILREGLLSLPSLILEAEDLVQKLQVKLRDVRQNRETREMKQGVKLEKKRLGKQIKNLEKWAKYVTVGSSPYYKIRDDIISAEEQLKMLESNIEE
ncbi:uncharacterized protein FIESC28_08800 [Fusarium coffeatum]|uniref:Uncharacterized protein n=1 Tax=Fusarium coffeatum TaxID=231269 RepID=A0A366R6W3_9HYPO|nr:uncharacterized protein FIESC28_08800 [Fusarium coffeatum]RBR11915.1 hypothetical protein FIESC28_08800 [Fusarium coffeatum]